MWWIIVVAIIGGLIVLGILLLSIPFDLTFRFESYSRPKFELRWAWFFGLLSGDFKPGKRKPGKSKARRKFDLILIQERVRTTLEFLRIRGLVTQFFIFIKRVWRSFKIRDFEAEFNIGLDDPSETFYLFAITEPFNRLINYVQPYAINIRPNFAEPVFEGYAHGSFRIYPFLLVPPMVQFIFSPPSFRLMGRMVAIRWKRKR